MGLTGRGEPAKLYVKIKLGENEVEFSGDKETVWTSINNYLSRVVGPLSIAMRLASQPDLERLSKILVDKVVINDGVVTVKASAEAKTRILYSLAAAYLGYRLGMLQEYTLTPSKVAQATRLDERVVRARLSDLWKEGLVERDEKGRYWVNTSAVDFLEVRGG